MKKIIVKRLIYSNGKGEEHIGNNEFFGTLSDECILGSVHEIGKTTWIGSQLWLMRAGVPTYRITVGTFTQYQKSWYDWVIDAVRRA